MIDLSSFVKNILSNKSINSLETSLSLIDKYKSESFKKLNYSVWVIIIFYSFFYYKFNATFAFWTVFLGSSLVVPLILFLEKKKFDIISRYLFLISCDSYIFLTGISFPESVSVEYYFLPALMVPLLIFDKPGKRDIIIGILITFIFWLMEAYFGKDLLPNHLKATDIPEDFLKNVNFIGAFSASFVFQLIFMQHTFRIKDILVENAKSEGERHQLITSSMSEGLVIQSENGTIISHNPAALEILNLTEKELDGRTSMDPRWRAIKEDGSDFPGEEHPSMIALKTNQPVTDQIMGLEVPSGEKKWIKINAIPVETEKGRHVIVTFNDITESYNATKDIQRIFNNSLDLMCIATPDGKFKKISPSFSKILDYSEQELLNTPYMDIIHPEDLDSVYKALEQLSSGSPLINFESRTRTKTGDYRLINWFAEPDLKTGLIYATGRDVTDLRNEEIRNREILNAINQNAIVSFTNEKGEIKQVNSNFCVLSGYSESEIIGKKHSILKSGVHDQNFYDEMWKTIKSGGYWSQDFTNKSKKGNLYHIRSVISPIKDTEGNIKEYISISWDKTNEVEQQNELMYQINFNNAIRKSARFSIITTTIDGIITGFNNEAERILGYSAEEMVGKCTPAVFHDVKEIEKTAKQLSKEFNEQVPVGFETFVFKAKRGLYDERQWTYIRKDGKRVQVSLSITALKTADDELYGYMGIAKDLTEDLKIQRELEYARAQSIHTAKLASLGEMAAGIAHEINNPLAIITGNVELMKKQVKEPEKILSKAETIIKASQRIQKIVNGLRKFSRTTEGQNYKENILENIINETLTIIEYDSKKFATPILIETKPGLKLFCDEVEIEQVLVNLIKNGIDAVKKCEEKWVKIKSFKDNDEIVIQIMDSGNLLPIELEQKIFQPFFTTKPVGEGTGLGLSISKGILDQHKAKIFINRSVPNTCFEIRFLSIEAAKNVL